MSALAVIPSCVALVGFAVNELQVWRSNKNSSRTLAKAQKKPPPPSSEGCEYGGTRLP